MWKYLGAMGPSATEDRLAALNLLLFAVSVGGGYFCPSRPRDFVGRVMKESLVTPGHLDLWMKDLSPDDSRVSAVPASCSCDRFPSRCALPYPPFPPISPAPSRVLFPTISPVRCPIPRPLPYPLSVVLSPVPSHIPCPCSEAFFRVDH